MNRTAELAATTLLQKKSWRLSFCSILPAKQASYFYRQIDFKEHKNRNMKSETLGGVFKRKAKSNDESNENKTCIHTSENKRN